MCLPGSVGFVVILIPCDPTGAGAEGEKDCMLTVMMTIANRTEAREHLTGSNILVTHLFFNQNSVMSCETIE